MAFPPCPDPAVMVAECFGEVILAPAAGAVKDMRQAFPGATACQFSADFGDDASLDALAQGLSRVAAATGRAGVRAGAAPWHDDPALYENCSACRPAGAAVPVAASVGHLRPHCRQPGRGQPQPARPDCCAGYGLPRVSLVSPQQGQRPDKLAAFAETWEPQAVPYCVGVDQIEPGLMQALGVPADLLRENAAGLRACYLQSQAQWVGLLTP
jgi:hypothetical protein